jgi:hypothetical protein
VSDAVCLSIIRFIVARVMHFGRLFPESAPLLRTDEVLCSAKREFLDDKLRSVEGRLQESKADRAANGREKSMAEALAQMKRNISGTFASVLLPTVGPPVNE